jgi:hypothetical protein
LAVLLTAVACVACASGGSSPPDADTYIKWVAYEVPVNEFVLLRWPKRKMPLRIFLPRPPEGFFENPDAIYDSVRDGVLDWSGVAGPDLPSFVFVDEAGDADIPIVWAAEPDGDWYIAYCTYGIHPFARRFAVDQIVVTGRWPDGHVADLHDVYAVVLHEMGHALGLTGHSPNREDIMYESVPEATTPGLSARDRATLTLLYASPIGKRVVGARGGR